MWTGGFIKCKIGNEIEREREMFLYGILFFSVELEEMEGDWTRMRRTAIDPVCDEEKIMKILIVNRTSRVLLRVCNY